MLESGVISEQRMAEIAARSHIGSMEEYERLYRLSLDDPDTFWSKEAENIDWFHRWLGGPPERSPRIEEGTGEIARRLAVPIHRINYVIRSRGIRPERRAGNARQGLLAAALAMALERCDGTPGTQTQPE